MDKKIEPNPDLLTVAEAAAHTRLSVGALAQLRYLKKGPKYLKPSKSILYPLEALNEWLNASAVTPAAA